MSVILFLLFFALAAYLLPRIAFLKKTGLSATELRLLFALKVAAGTALALVNTYWYGNTTDYDQLNNYGIWEHALLLADPRTFFTDIFYSGYGSYGDFFGTQNSYWNNLPENIIIKLLALFNFLSRGNYFINALFFNIIFFFGHAAFYRVFMAVRPAKYPLLAGCFLLPSMLYFSSGIHKDGIIFTALGMFCFALFSILKSGSSAKKWLLLAGAFIVMLLVRNFVAVLLAPFALLWVIQEKFRISAVRLYISAVCIAVVAAIGLHTLSFRYSPLRAVQQRQAAFLKLPRGKTDLGIEPLEPTPKSFAAGFPGALRRAFLSPLPGEFRGWAILALGAEILLYSGIVLFALIFRRSKIPRDPFLAFSFCFALTLILFAAYITPAAGALVRYRSIYFTLLLCPVLPAFFQSGFLYYRK